MKMKEYSEKQLKDGMTYLEKECHKAGPDYRKIIASAVSLGMKYQEAKIREGINIVFEEIHK